MFQNNLKIAWRHLIKDRQFTLLNIMGLTAGLACALLIWSWVNDELSVDRFFENDSRLYQVMERRTYGGQTGTSVESSGMLAETLKGQLPEVAYAAALAPPGWWQKFTLSVGGKDLKATGQYAGPDYFNIFSFKLIEGASSQVLQDKSSIVISDELAGKLFGSVHNAVGKTIRFQQERNFIVSGVFKKIPYQSSTQFDFVLSFEYLKGVEQWVTGWNNIGPLNFVLLKKGTNINSFNKKIAGIVARNGGDSSRIAFASLFSNNYLESSYENGSKVGGKMQYIRLFSLIAIFILVIACINFMNLSTAKASQRMKEVGIKKVVGASRWQLMFQFLTESGLLTLFSVTLAVVVTWLLLPRFNEITGKQISLVFNSRLILTIVIVTVITCLLAGSYPALYLSKFKPIKILKGKFQSSIGEAVSRKGLVVFQFTLSVMLIVSVLVVYKQIQYIQDIDPGYNKDNVIRFNTEGRIQGTEETFISEMKKIPGVVNASFTFNNMVGRNFGIFGLDWEGKDPHADIYFEGFGAGFQLIETMGINMAQGRSFSKSYGDDSTKIILNESAVSVMHLKNAVGKIIRVFNRPMQIIGVMKDFHFESVHEKVKPSYMTLIDGNNPKFRIMCRIKAGQEKETLSRIQRLYETYNPGFPFDFSFLDEAYQKQYETETRVGVLSGYFAGLAILISCLGLFGLAAFTAQRRRKEIGIRKVVGASVKSITAMLSKDFLKLVMIAVVIAFPLSWWATSLWLASFAYRVTIGAGIYFIAAASVLLITLLTISFQSIKAALTNPVKSLRAD